MNDYLIDHLEIKNIVIMDSDISGDIYMEKLFPLWTDVVVLTLEGKYPYNQKLRSNILKELKINEKIYCFCFGADSDKYQMATQKKLRMAPFFFKDLKFSPYNQVEFGFDEEKIIALMMAFVGDSMSRLRIERIDRYDSLLDYAEADSVKWYHHLIKSKSD
jgi:hypothetical protein